jgi:hypothetical protein
MLTYWNRKVHAGGGGVLPAQSSPGFDDGDIESGRQCRIGKPAPYGGAPLRFARVRHVNFGHDSNGTAVYGADQRIRGGAVLLQCTLV